MKVHLSYWLALVLSSSAVPVALGDNDDHVFYRGAPLNGGSEGIFFDPIDNGLYVAQVFAQTISKLDPETGQVLDEIAGFFENGVGIVDDLAVSPDGTTLYWTEPFLGTVVSRKLTGNGTSVPLYPYGSYPNANPVTVSDDGRYLFFGQCWDTQNTNGIFQLDLVTNETTTILDGIFGCAANAFDYHNGSLYLPRPFEGRVVKLDVSTGVETNVTSEWGGTPNSCKFDTNKEMLYAINSAIGEVVRIDINNNSTTDNREVLAKLPLGWMDNFALDKDDRVYVSSYTEAAIWEVLPQDNGGVSEEFRTVSQGGISIPMGIALLNETTVYTVQPFALYELDETGTLASLVRSVPIIGVLHDPTSIAAWDDKLVLSSFISGALAVWDPVAQTNDLVTEFAGPIDAHPFGGGLLVTEFFSGDVTKATGSDLSQRETILAMAGVRFLAGNEDDVYVSVSDEGGSGRILQIISNGGVLDPPVTVASELVNPEGMALSPDGTELLVVTNTGSGTLFAIDITSGEARPVATDLGFVPEIPGATPFGFANDVAVNKNGDIYLNGDGANVIYKFSSGEVLDPLGTDTPPPAPTDSDMPTAATSAAFSSTQAVNPYILTTTGFIAAFFGTLMRLD